MGPRESGGIDVLDDLRARGLVQDSTDLEALGARLAAGPITVYYGLDPTAPSLHHGNLVGLVVLRRFQLAGHRPIALVGGATGMVGDPSGRSEERNLLDDDTVGANVAAIGRQVERVLGPPGEWLLVDNGSWTRDLPLLVFLRDVGKHVTVNQMVAKESIRSRMEGTEGISFTEFAYMLLQAYDYLWLATHEGCELQIGGSEQWGNITAGIDLVRRKTGRTVHGLTWPLITDETGAKVGKSTGARIWLDPARTSPYRLYQHFMQTDDDQVERLLLWLTLLPVPEVQAVIASHREAPERRTAQRLLAGEVTALVHGPEEVAAAEGASSIVFGSDVTGASEASLASLAGDLDTTAVDRGRLEAGIDLVDLLVETGLASSKGEARRTLGQGGVYVNDRRADGDGVTVGRDDLLYDRYLLLRRGKRQYHLVRTS